LLSSLLNITVAYFGYKWFVFKTKGNYLREWMRCVAVYSGGIIFALPALPALVVLIRHNTRFLPGSLHCRSFLDGRCGCLQLLWAQEVFVP